MRLLKVDLFNNGESVTVIDNEDLLNKKLGEFIRDNYSTKVKDIIDDFYKTYIENNNIETPIEEFISKCRNNLEYVDISLNNNGGLNVSYGIKVIPYNPDRAKKIPLTVTIILNKGTYEFIDYSNAPAPLYVPFIKE